MKEEGRVPEERMRRQKRPGEPRQGAGLHIYSWPCPSPDVLSVTLKFRKPS